MHVGDSRAPHVAGVSGVVFPIHRVLRCRVLETHSMVPRERGERKSPLEVLLGVEAQRLCGQRVLNPDLKVNIVFKMIP